MLEKEFNSMVGGHISSLKQNALTFTKNLDEANDLVQDTLVKAIRFYKTYQAGTNFKGWLFVIMKNTFLNECRKEARKRTLFERDDEISSVKLLYSSEQNKCTGTLIMNDVKKILNSLPEVYRIPFIRYSEGYKYIEIAEQQNIPLGTVKTRIREARLILKRKLKVYSIT